MSAEYKRRNFFPGILIVIIGIMIPARNRWIGICAMNPGRNMPDINNLWMFWPLIVVGIGIMIMIMIMIMIAFRHRTGDRDHRYRDNSMIWPDLAGWLNFVYGSDQ